MWQDGILLTVTVPRFFEQSLELSFSVSNNLNRKALGFGALGVGLTLIRNGQKTSVPCKGLTTEFMSSDLKKNVMVDGGQEGRLSAVFDPQPACESAHVLIQANRIGAAPYLFRLTFDLRN
jgi:hypothetical protein